MMISCTLSISNETILFLKMKNVQEAEVVLALELVQMVGLLVMKIMISV